MTEPVSDYYTELGLERGASSEELRKRLTAEHRKWSNRASRASGVGKRREAEDTVTLIGLAQKALLDDTLRAEYHRRLDLSRRKPPQPAPRQQPEPVQTPPAEQPTGRDWLGEAIAKTNSGDYPGALYDAKQAVHYDDANPDCWHVLGVLHWKSGDRTSAQQELRRAHDLQQRNVVYLSSMAGFLAETNLADAVPWYERIVEIAPDDDGIRVLAGALYQLARNDEALQWYEKLLTRTPGDPEVRNQIGRIWSLRSSGSVTLQFGRTPVVTSPEAVERILHCVEQALLLDLSDQPLVDKLVQDQRLARSALRRTWRWSTSVGLSMLAVVLIDLFLLPDDGTLGGVLDITAFVALVGLPIRIGLKPRWRHNRNA